MKVSVVSTVLNESASISLLLSSLLDQKRIPDEIIIIDGGSTDGTMAILQNYAKKYPIVRYYISKGNISHGRNIGIQKSRYEIIAIIDGGCRAKDNWLETLTNPFKNSTVDVVSGFYQMVTVSSFQKALAPFIGVTSRRFNPHTYLPSARSMAFRKKIWKELKGFNENLSYAGEDTLFNYQIVKNNYTMIREPKALVEWDVPISFIQAVSKFFSYAKGDAQTGIWWHPIQKANTHSIKILTIYLRYFVLISLLFLTTLNISFFYIFILILSLYLLWSYLKMRNDVNVLSARLLVPLIQISSDIAVMFGFLSGQISKSNFNSK